MKCENCNCDTFIIYIGEEHERICMECYQDRETGDEMLQPVNKAKQKKSKFG